MQFNAHGQGERRTTSATARSAAGRTMPRRLVVFVGLVTLSGAIVLAQSLAVIRHVPADVYFRDRNLVTPGRQLRHDSQMGAPAQVSALVLWIH